MKLNELTDRAVSNNILPPNMEIDHQDIIFSLVSSIAKEDYAHQRLEHYFNEFIGLINSILILQEDVIKKELLYNNESTLLIKLDTLSGIQAEHKKWIEHNFPDSEAVDFVLGAAEEVGELCHSFLKRKQAIRVNENHTENIKDAVADIIIYLIGFCNTQEIHIEENLVEVWSRVKKRNWNTNKNNGDSKEVSKALSNLATDQDYNQLSLFPGQ